MPNQKIWLTHVVYKLRYLIVPQGNVTLQAATVKNSCQAPLVNLRGIFNSAEAKIGNVAVLKEVQLKVEYRRLTFAWRLTVDDPSLFVWLSRHTKRKKRKKIVEWVFICV